MTISRNIEDAMLICQILIGYGTPIALCWWAGVPWYITVVVVVWICMWANRVRI